MKRHSLKGVDIAAEAPTERRFWLMKAEPGVYDTEAGLLFQDVQTDALRADSRIEKGNWPGCVFIAFERVQNSNHASIRLAETHDSIQQNR